MPFIKKIIIIVVEFQFTNIAAWCLAFSGLQPSTLKVDALCDHLALRMLFVYMPRHPRRKQQIP